MSAFDLTRSPRMSERKSFRRRFAAWAGIEDRPPAGHASWWFPSETAASSGRSTSYQTQGTLPPEAQERRGRVRSRKRDWFKILLAARNLATVVYAVSNTITQPVLPFMVNRLIYPQPPEFEGDPGSEGVREAWRGLAYGAVMSGYYLTKIISAPWIGFLSDKVGRRQALVVTLVGGALVFFLTRIWGQYSIHSLIMCRLLMGCFAANGALMHAYIRDTVPPEWQSSAFSQHSASWGCAYLAAPALIAWAGDSADAILSVATVTMLVSAIIVEITFVDTRPEEFRNHRMSSIVGDYLKEGARDLAEVGRKMSGVDLAEYFNGGKEKEAKDTAPPTPSATTMSIANGGVARDIGSVAGEEGVGDGSAERGGDRNLRRRKVGLDEQQFSRGVANGRDGVSNGITGSAEGGREGEEVAAATTTTTTTTTTMTTTTGTDSEGERGGGKRPRLGNMVSSRGFVGVFKGMMRERLVQVTFVLQAIRPAQDLAPLVARKFSGGASVLAGITSSRSLCRVLVPMTPLIPWLVRLAGGSSSEGAAARMRGDRAVAACMCLLMAGIVVFVPAVDSLRELHHLMAFNGLCYIVRESTAGAVMARAARTSSVGAFFGWQHCMKGIQGSLSHFLTGWLSGYSTALPYYLVAVCDLLYAFTYLYIS